MRSAFLSVLLCNFRVLCRRGLDLGSPGRSLSLFTHRECRLIFVPGSGASAESRFFLIIEGSEVRPGWFGAA